MAQNSSQTSARVQFAVANGAANRFGYVYRPE